MIDFIKKTMLVLGIAIIGGISAVTIQNYFLTTTNKTVIKGFEKIPSKTVNTIYNPQQVQGFQNAAAISVNAVVHVKTESIVNREIDPLYKFFYGNQYQPEPQITTSSGSGVIISDDGYIVTNNHVVNGAENVTITLNNKKAYQAKIIGNDPSTDLALLKINEASLPYIAYGNSNEVNVGEWVIAVGNPYNLTSTVTAGIVSAKGRDINILRGDRKTGVSAIESFIQTDAAVNPGNSGGALVNVKGELIGINTAIQSQTGSYTGYSFAIPINIVKKVIDDLKNYGVVQRAYIGVSISNINSELAEKLDLEDLNGVYVSAVVENGSAQKAGIKPGDIIKKIDESTINNVPELQEKLSQHKPGDKINVTISRDNKTLSFKLPLKNLQGDEKIVANSFQEIKNKLGIELEELKKDELTELGIKNGVKVSKISDGIFKEIGIQKGFIITRINNQNISNSKQLLSILEDIKGGVLVEGIYKKGKKEFYGFGLK